MDQWQSYDKTIFVMTRIESVMTNNFGYDKNYDKVMTKLWQSYDKVMIKLWQSYDKAEKFMTKNLWSWQR